MQHSLSQHLLDAEQSDTGRGGLEAVASKGKACAEEAALQEYEQASQRLGERDRRAVIAIVVQRLDIATLPQGPEKWSVRVEAGRCGLC